MQTRPTNTCPALVALPISVLQRILEHCDLVTRIALADTCHALRVDACSISHIWSQIGNYSLRTCNLLRRCYPAPIVLCISVGAWELTNTFYDFFSEVFPRLEHLELTVSALWFCHPSKRALLLDVTHKWGTLINILGSPAPMMHTLLLTLSLVSDLQGSAFHIADDLLNGDPGRLRSCTLVGIHLPLSGVCTALSLLTTFNYVHPLENLDQTHFDALWRVAPGCETFGLHVSGTTFGGIQPSTRPPLKRAAITLETSLRSALEIVKYLGPVDELVLTNLPE